MGLDEREDGGGLVTICIKFSSRISVYLKLFSNASHWPERYKLR